MEVKEIEISKIRPNPSQARKDFDKEKLKELADSIKLVGILNPITVKEKDGMYEIVAGERRWLASRLAKKKTIPAIVREYKKSSAVESLIENVHRKDLTDDEKGKYLKEIMKKEGISNIGVLAKKIGMSRRGAEQIIDVSEFRKKYHDTKKISQKVIRSTMGFPDDERIKMVRLSAKKGFSGLKMETQVRPLMKKASRVIKDAVFDEKISIEEAGQIIDFDDVKQEATILSIQQFKKTMEQIPRSIKKGTVFEKERKTALDVIKKLKSELGSTTGKLYKMEDILSGFCEKNIFEAIPKEYKEVILGILEELEKAQEELTKTLKKSKNVLIKNYIKEVENL